MTTNRPIIRDRKWLNYLHTQRCLISGQYGNDNETVDPMHLGAFKGMKRSDDEVIPVLHRFHLSGHQSGEISMLRSGLSDTILREALRAYARALYKEWKDQNESPK